MFHGFDNERTYDEHGHGEDGEDGEADEGEDRPAAADPRSVQRREERRRVLSE